MKNLNQKSQKNHLWRNILIILVIVMVYALSFLIYKNSDLFKAEIQQLNLDNVVDFSYSPGNNDIKSCIGRICPVWESSKSARYHNFDGKDDYIEVSHNDDLDFTSEYTLTAWVNPDIIKSYSPIFIRSSEKGDDIEVYIRGDGLILAHNRLIREKLSHVEKNELPKNPLANKWTYITVTWKDKKWKLYYNGILEYTSTTKDNPKDTNGKWLIGKSLHKAFGTNNAFDGKMDKIAIFNSALTDTKILDMYKANAVKTTYNTSDDIDDTTSDLCADLACPTNSSCSRGKCVCNTGYTEKNCDVCDDGYVDVGINDEMNCKKGVIGDVNADSKLTMDDIKMSFKIVNGSIKPTQLQKKIADMNIDGSVTMMDVILLFNHLMSKI